MRASSFLMIAGVVGIAFALAILIATPSMLQLYGQPIEPANVLLARYFGTSLLAWALIVWLLRSAQDILVQRALLRGSAVGYALGGMLALFSVTSGLENAMAWSSVAIYAALSGGAIYCLMTSRALRPAG